MSNLDELFSEHATVKDLDWWAFKVVIWYCKGMQIALPRTRCHFGEILFLYAPFSFLVILFFKACFHLGKGIIFLVTAIANITRIAKLWQRVWGRFEKDKQEHKGRMSIVTGCTVAVTLLGVFLMLFFVYESPDNQGSLQCFRDVILILLSIFFVWLSIFFLVYGAIFSIEAIEKPLGRIIGLSKAAVNSTPVINKVSVVVARKTANPIDVGRTFWRFLKSSYRRKVCPIITYEVSREELYERGIYRIPYNG